MNIGLDYDDTFTADPALWTTFCRTARLLGHHVSFVTARFKKHPDGIMEWAAKLGIPVVFCEGRAKNECFEADVWIDDNPHSIHNHMHHYGKDDYGDDRVYPRDQGETDGS